MAAFSSPGQLRRRPAPVNTSMRRARSGIGVSSDIDICRSSKPAPNVTPHAWLRKALPGRRLHYDDAGFQLVGTILGSGSDVDDTMPEEIGASLIGGPQVGADVLSTVFPYYAELKIKTPKF